MTPAEIWQGGKIINKIKGVNTHTGSLHGKDVLVEDSAPGCRLEPKIPYMAVGNSITLDGGEIVKSVNK
jgi:hypothetical protein